MRRLDASPRRATPGCQQFPIFRTAPRISHPATPGDLLAFAAHPTCQESSHGRRCCGRPQQPDCNRTAAVDDESYRLLLVLRRKCAACRTYFSLSRRIGQLSRVSTEAGTVQPPARWSTSVAAEASPVVPALRERCGCCTALLRRSNTLSKSARWCPALTGETFCQRRPGLLVLDVRARPRPNETRNETEAFARRRRGTVGVSMRQEGCPRQHRRSSGRPGRLAPRARHTPRIAAAIADPRSRSRDAVRTGRRPCLPCGVPARPR